MSARKEHPRNRQIGTQLDEETFEQVRAVASEEDRPLGAAVRRLVIEALEARRAASKRPDSQTSAT
ncbi:MAG: hypothetical protein DIJKHBIC_04168 [Thermoanaerobaculia bacterium]|nr:hypothetical protein [Thermoanaerobaculia bacterium]